MNETTVAPRIRFRGFDSGWEEKTFSDLYRLNVRKNDLTYGNEDIISVAKMFYAPNPMVTDEDYLRTYNVIEKGEIAFEGNRSGDYAYGRFVENDIGNGIVSHVFQVFSPIVSMDIDYWKYAINDERIMRPVLANSTKTSTMMMEIVPSRFLNQKVHVPCLEEQEKIGSLLTLVDRLIALYEKVIPIFDILVRSRFIEMFGNCRESVEIGKVCSLHSRIGWQALTKAEHMDSGEYMLVTGTDFANGKVNWSNCKYVSKKRYEMDPNIIIQNGDILVTKDGTIGKVAIVENIPGPATLNAGIFVVRNTDNSFLTEYLQQCLLSIDFQRFIESVKRGATITHLNQKKFLKYMIPIAELSLQKRFVGFVKQVNKSRFDYIKKYEALKMLRESLMCGMLIPVSDEEENKMRS